MNPASPYDALPDFTSYSLRVASTDGRTVIAPGKREAKEGVSVLQEKFLYPGWGFVSGILKKYDVLLTLHCMSLLSFEGHGSFYRDSRRFGIQFLLSFGMLVIMWRSGWGSRILILN